ncbi:MAG: hypothetical protein JRI68_19570, partial [Deltaproteobacteria bacterium]|nr:hypothetical protein [Deltaproteobacteria bacterium]
MMKRVPWVVALFSVAAIGGFAYGCSESGDTGETGVGGTTSGSGTGGASAGGGGSSSGDGAGGSEFWDAGQGGGVEQDACADVVVEGNPTIKPADIVFV